MRLYEESLNLLDARRTQLNPNDFNIIYMGDSWVEKSNIPHYSFTSNEIFSTAITEVKKHNPLFIMHGGDIVYTGSKDLLENFAAQKTALAPEIPLFVAIGNHEMEPTPSGPWSPENYLNIIGPLHFALNLPDFRLSLIVLNTLYHFVYQEYGLTEEELAFLRDSLRNRENNTFVSTHVPPRSSEWPNPDDSFAINSSQFLRIMEDKVSLALVSHIHTYDDAEVEGTDFILSGCTGAPPNVNELNHIVVINIRYDGRKSPIHYEMIPVGWT